MRFIDERPKCWIIRMPRQERSGRMPVILPKGANPSLSLDKAKSIRNRLCTEEYGITYSELMAFCDVAKNNCHRKDSINTGHSRVHLNVDTSTDYIAYRATWIEVLIEDGALKKTQKKKLFKIEVDDDEQAKVAFVQACALADHNRGLKIKSKSSYINEMIILDYKKIIRLKNQNKLKKLNWPNVKCSSLQTIPN